MCLRRRTIKCGDDLGAALSTSLVIAKIMLIRVLILL